MPLGRYLLYVGGVLLTLLFLIDAHLPHSAAGPAAGDIDRSIIRIQSAYRWPSAVVFDTSQPTIVPPPPEVIAEAPPQKSPRDAYAMAHAMGQPAQPAHAVATASPAPRKRVPPRVRVARAPAPRIANDETIGFRNPFSPGWW
jgi:hypothetical protein